MEQGFEDREGQWTMSCEIVDAMQKKKHIAIEAGVGIGKFICLYRSSAFLSSEIPIVLF